MYLKGSFESFYKYVVIQFIVKNGNGFIFPHRIFLGKKHFWQKWWELKKKDSKFQILNVKSSVCSCLTSRSVINLKIPADVSSERLSSALVQLFVFYQSRLLYFLFPESIWQNWNFQRNCAISRISREFPINVEMESLADSTCNLAIKEVQASLDDEDADIILKTNDGTLKAHKFVLRGCPYFAAIVDGNWRESQASIITLDMYDTYSTTNNLLDYKLL